MTIQLKNIILSKQLSDLETPSLHTIKLLPRWFGDSEKSLSYLYYTTHFNQDQMIAAHEQLKNGTYINPRIITEEILTLSQVFQPNFFHALNQSIHHAQPLEMNCFPKQTMNALVSHRIREDLTRFWLQSMVFLSGVTLSAAIIQNRWSAGTLMSKYSRLWQAAVVADRMGYASVTALDLKRQVEALVLQSRDSSDLFFVLKDLFNQTLSALCENEHVGYSTMYAVQLSDWQRARFGFLNDLKSALGKELIAVLVYGSSLNSDDYADYDVLLVVRDTHAVLRQFSGKNPMFLGKELNIGVYSPEDFWVYQLMSGDNLPDYALCLYGEVVVPVKPTMNLVARNFSFGYVRLRQLLGMASFAACEHKQAPQENKHNLVNYFVKIPLNVLKGIQGALDQPMSKTEARNWCKNILQFNGFNQDEMCHSNTQLHNISSSAWCTLAILKHFNTQLSVYGVSSALIGCHAKNDTDYQTR